MSVANPLPPHDEVRELVRKFRRTVERAARGVPDREVAMELVLSGPDLVVRDLVSAAAYLDAAVALARAVEARRAYEPCDQGDGFGPAAQYDRREIQRLEQAITDALAAWRAAGGSGTDG